MDEKIYVFDTNIISSLLKRNNRQLLERIRQDQSNIFVLCEPIIFEVERGWLKKQEEGPLQRFRHEIIPLFNVVSVQLVDWQVAAELWAYSRNRGKTLSDMDLLLAAIALRLKGVVVTNDGDFKHLPALEVEDWLQA